MATDVARESIRHFPISNTEINFERLPSARALEGMELRYRDELSSSSMTSPWVVFVVLVSGQLYALGVRFLPEMLRWLWREAHSVEGMPVVGGMLAGLALLIALLCLVFVPHVLRVILAMVTLPLVVTTGAAWMGQTWQGYLAVGFAAFILSLVWKPSLITFHDSWLTADPRMTAAQAVAWKGRTKIGSVVPSIVDAHRIISRYLTAETPGGVPGMWIAPSSLTTRVAIASLLIGSIFAAAAGSCEVVSDFGYAALFSFAASAAALLVLTTWAASDACWLSAECERQFQPDQKSSFERRCDRLQNSAHEAADVITGALVREAEHLFLGFEPWQKFPVLLHKLMLYEHVHISGRTGSGKTSMALMQMMTQLIRGHREIGGKWSEKTPMIIIDLKGDEVLFQTAKLEAAARGQKFRFFTLEPGKASFHFNPFLGFKSGTLSVPQLVHLNLDALDLYHGTGYGRGYYSQRSRFLLSQALRNPIGVNSFHDLYARLKALYAQHPDDFRDAFELLSVIESLTFYDQLVTTPAQEQGDDTIRLDRMLEDQEVVYFWLPSAKESATVAQLGKLVLFNLRTAAQDRQSAGKKRQQMFLLIDEFQKLAGENFQQILQQARSAGIAAVLANQSLADLKTPDWDLTPTIRTNTRTKMYFSITEPDEIQVFRELAGEELQIFGQNDVEEIRPRFSIKDLASLSDHPKRLLLQATSGSGYTQFGGLPIPVETDWPITKEVSDKRAAMPWPSYPRVVTPAPAPPKVSIKPPTPTAPAATLIASPAATAPAVRPIAPPPPLKPAPAQPSALAVAPSSTAAIPSTPKPTPVIKPVVPPAATGPAKKQGPRAAPVPTRQRKPPKVPSTPQPPKPAPAPAVKAAFAKTIKNLMDE